MRQVAAYPLAKRIDLDESGIASREVYPYGWSKRIQALIAVQGAHLLFLAPYSLDFNPIEHCWFTIKNYMRQYLDSDYSLMDTASLAFHQSA